jgi:hypothetical protein
MAKMAAVERGAVFMGRLPHGSDLLEELTTICRDQGFSCGRIEAIGAVQKASIGYYDQSSRTYEYMQFDEALEILKLCGNISIKDGEPMVHAHITLGDKEGRAFGGHLGPGTIVFACECLIEAFEGPAFERAYDEETGLPLWDMP